jgi:hypothetical protein
MRICVCLLGLTLLSGTAALADTVSVELAFSDKALAELQSRGEGVILRSNWIGEPAEGATMTDPETGMVYLQWEELTIYPGPATLVLGANLSSAPLDQVIEPALNLNVFSARWTDDNNLLACDVLDAPLSQLVGSTHKLTCKLIGE